LARIDGLEAVRQGKYRTGPNCDADRCPTQAFDAGVPELLLQPIEFQGADPGP
jgi:hypothetical protein